MIFHNITLWPKIAEFPYLHQALADPQNKPYITFAHNRTYKQTDRAYQVQNDPSPRWNESIKFDMLRASEMVNEMFVNVYLERAGNVICLGKTEINLRQVKDFGKGEGWFELRSDEGRAVVGRLFLVIDVQEVLQADLEANQFPYKIKNDVSLNESYNQYLIRNSNPIMEDGKLVGYFDPRQSDVLSGRVMNGDLDTTKEQLGQFNPGWENIRSYVEIEQESVADRAGCCG